MPENYDWRDDDADRDQDPTGIYVLVFLGIVIAIFLGVAWSWR